MVDNRLRRASLVEVIKGGEFASHLEELQGLALQDDAAAIALGYIYFCGGRGVPRDYGKALRWFKKVEKESDVNGFVAWHLAIMYYRGLGVLRNNQLAAKYLRRAALCGHSKSRIFFAILQKKGDGTLRKQRSAETILRAGLCDSSLNATTRLLALVWLLP